MDYLYIWQSNHQIGMFHPLFSMIANAENFRETRKKNDHRL